MKIKLSIIPLMLIAVLAFVGCRKNSENANDKDSTEVTEDNSMNNDQANTENENDKESADAVTSPSRVNDEASLLNALDNSWIVILEKDIATTQELELETGYQKDGEGDASKKVDTPRVLVLLKKDEKNEVTDTYTLETPKLTIKDEGAKIEGGTIKGDVYIEANNVNLQEAKIEGNVYFTSEEAKSSFTLDEGSNVSGNMEVQQ
jgi:hypothetical protein